jgi:predicted transposase YdaD
MEGFGTDSRISSIFLWSEVFVTNVGQNPCSATEWKRLYQAALLEVDLTSLPQRIEEAKAAIARRVADLEGQDALEERLAMLETLNDLAKMNGRAHQDGTA